MTSIDEFLAVARKKRRRGRLDEHSDEIVALRSAGASYGEIVEFLSAKYSVSVSRSTILRHLDALPANQSASRDVATPSIAAPRDPLSDVDGKRAPPPPSSGFAEQRVEGVATGARNSNRHDLNAPPVIPDASPRSEMPMRPEVESATTPPVSALPTPARGRENRPPIDRDSREVVERDAGSEDDLVTRYRFGGAEHKALMAAYRARKRQSED